MTQELREAILSAWGAPEHDDIMPKRADAAIALVLEEAAKVALGEYRRSSSGEEIASAIRALKEKSDE